MNKVVLNDLYDYVPLKIYQNEDNFKFSLDSILLAEYVDIKSKTKSILDICTGCGSVPLILSTKTNALIDGCEIQENIFNLAVDSIKYNNLDNQITIFNCDAKDLNEFVKNKKYDIITCNPPYFKLSGDNIINENEELAIARHELKINLDDVFKIASSHLNDKGEFYLVHRVDRMDEVIITANKYNLNVKKITLVKTKEVNQPTLLLVKCIKNSGFGVKVTDVFNIEERETYKDMFK